MSNLFLTNWQLFLSQRENIATDKFRQDVITRYQKLLDLDTLEHYLGLDFKKFGFQSVVPRDKDGLQRWSSYLKDFPGLPCLDIRQYYDQLQDYHQLEAGVKLLEILSHNDICPSEVTVEPIAPIGGLICFGTGTGKVINGLIQKFQPLSVTIIVDSWEALATSFYHIDWASITDYCKKRKFPLEIVRVQDQAELLPIICKKGFNRLESLYIYREPSPSESLEKFYQFLGQREAMAVMGFTGYITDEYNMMINTVANLKSNHQIICKPIVPVAGNVVICASGPSLDMSIPELKQLQKSHLIVASGSSLKTLLLNGIRVDICTLLERGSLTYDLYHELSKEYNLKEIRLVMSVTCDPRLPSLFQKTILFFRPALTPLAVFSSSPDQILTCEGPQVINTSYSFVSMLEPSNIVLIGADLGSSSEKKARSDSAVGSTPRVFDIPVRGNLKPEVYTNYGLIDVKFFLETLAAYNSKNTSIKSFNCSDGVLINDFASCDLNAYVNKYKGDSLELSPPHGKPISLIRRIDEWILSLPSYTQKDVRSLLDSRDIRLEVCALSRLLQKLITSDDPWFPDLTDKIEDALSLDNNISLPMQVPRRIMRGCILKTSVGITQQLEIMKKDSNPTNMLKFESSARKMLAKLVSNIEYEIYALVKYLEKSL